MKINVLVDNTLGPDARLQAEHGLSFYFEADGQRFLLDTGASDAFAENAALMGIDIAAVDHLILSHAHADHTGGLATFLRANDKAQIWLSSAIDGRHFYSTRRGTCRDISIDYRLLDAHPERFHAVSAACRLSPSVTLLTEIPLIHPQPRANDTLYASAVAPSADSAHASAAAAAAPSADSAHASGAAAAAPSADSAHASGAAAAAPGQLVPDDFSHELAVLVTEPDGVTVLSSCSHKGILNTLAAAHNFLQAGTPLRAYVGGLHLVESDENHHFETADELSRIGDTLLTSYPGLKVFTGHCTGATAVRTLQQIMGSHLEKFYTGFSADTLA